ncbi:MAG: hypothetical protein V3T41_12000 [bacterium]
MTVRKEVTVQHGFSREEIAEAVTATLLLLWGYKEPSPGTFESDICINLIKWPGDRFTVDITREGIIKIVSESKSRLQLFDFGNNRENIKKFLDALKYTFSTSGLAKSKREGYSSFMSNESTHIKSRSSAENILPNILVTIITIILVCVIVPLVFVLLVAFVFFVFFSLLP